MKRLAILSPGHLPVPAVNGGAVEALITYLIEQNEINHEYDIDLYTINDEKLNNVKYNNTKIIKINNYYHMRVIFKIKSMLYEIFNVDGLFNYYAYKSIKYMNKNNIKYDIVLVENNMIVYGELYKKYRYFNETKKIYHIHNVIYDKDEKKFKYLFDLINKTSDVAIAVSNYMKNYLESKINKDVKVLYNCIDFNKYDLKENNQRNIIRDEYNIVGYNFIFTGRCVEDKGVLEMVNSFLKLYNENKDCSLSICGIHLDKPNLFEKRIIEISKSNSNIHLFNYTNHSNLVKYISASDCVIIPSKCDEAFGVVALEAMAMNKTIISSNSGGLIEPLTNDCAIIIDKNNLENELFLSMKSVLLNTNRAEELSKKAYIRVCSIKDFNKENYLENFTNIIRNGKNE